MINHTCGVAVITCNGMKFLPQQLESICAQTRAVHHVVVSDDYSTDGTWEYLETWAKQVPFRITLIRNEPRLGLSANFDQAVTAVIADIIFSADQDDVWLPTKVETLAAVFEARPEVLLVHSDAILIDGNDQELGTTLFAELQVSNAERHAVRTGNEFHVYCCRNIVTGATAAFRKSLLALARPLPSALYHDHWLAFMAAAAGRVVLLDTPTIRYRLHGSNMVGVSVGKSKLGKLTKMRHYLWAVNSSTPLKSKVDGTISSRTALYKRLSSHPEMSPRFMAVATEALGFAKWRSSLPHNPVTRAVAVLGNASAGRYRRFSHEPWVDAIRDILNR